MLFSQFLCLFLFIIYLAIIFYIIYLFIYYKSFLYDLFNYSNLLNIYELNTANINPIYLTHISLLNNIYHYFKLIQLENCNSSCNIIYQLLIYTIKNYENIKNEHYSLYNTIKKSFSINQDIIVENNKSNNDNLEIENLPYLENNLKYAITIHQLITQQLPQLINNTIDNDDYIGCNTYYLALLIDIQTAMTNIITDTFKYIS